MWLNMYQRWPLLPYLVGKMLMSSSQKRVIIQSYLRVLRSNLTIMDKVTWGCSHQRLWSAVEIRSFTKIWPLQSLGRNHSQTTEREICLVDKFRKISDFSWLDSKRLKCLKMLSAHNCKSDRYEIFFRAQERLRCRLVWQARSHRPRLTWTFIPFPPKMAWLSLSALRKLAERIIRKVETKIPNQT